MSCYSIVTLKLSFKASPEELVEALKEMKIETQRQSALNVEADSIQLTRVSITSPWQVKASAEFDSRRFNREVARVKALSEARRLGYRVTREERQGERIVLRLAAR